MRAAIATIAMTSILAGCAGIPDSGPVERVSAPGTRTHSTVRYEPARPRPGATPQQIVHGYVDAMLAYPEATGIVQSYLTPNAASAWKSTAGMVVYSQVSSKLRDVDGDLAEVSLQAHRMLTVDQAGRASVQGGNAQYTLRLERSAGEWRVANPVPGYVVSRRFADDYLRSFPLWFFDASGRRLVPELVHSVVNEQLPLVLTRRLADGPQEGVLRTYLPGPDNLHVTVTGRIVQVDVRGSGTRNSDEITAQLLSTLRGASGLDGVRILFNGVPEGDVHPIDAVVGFGPGRPGSHVYGVRGNRVVDVDGERIRSVAGPWGRSAQNAVGVAVDSATIAAVQGPRTSVVIGARRGGDLSRIEGVEFADPVWDGDHRLWLVDNPGDIRIRVIKDGETRTVDSAVLQSGELPVQSLRISPDDSRYAVVVRAGKQAAVEVGAIERDVDGAPTRLLRPQVVSRGMTGEQNVGWASQTRVEFIADGRFGPQLYSAGLDGADRHGGSRRQSLRGGVTMWAGSPVDRADRWALDSRGRLWRRTSGGPWHLRHRDALLTVSNGR